MASVMTQPASCLMALVTSSLVSRAATPGSTGTSQAQMAARTSLRASAAAAGPTGSLTRHACDSAGPAGTLTRHACDSADPVGTLTRHAYDSVGRVGAIAFIGFLSGPVLS